MAQPTTNTETDQEEAKFTKWLKSVDRLVQEKVFLSYQDLPDIDYRGLFEDGFTPAEAAQECLDNADDGYVE